MQEDSSPRTNEERAAATRAALMDAAKALFIKQGYAETGTPEIVREAGVTRGALYHHFDGKEGLLRAVIEREAAAISQEIRAGSVMKGSALEALEAGGQVYFVAMADEGRQRLMLRDGPAILGPQEMARIDRDAGAGELPEGLAALMGARAPEPEILAALADILSAGFDRSVQSGDSDVYARAMRRIFEGLAR